MHILVTGGAGYVGSSLVPLLLNRGYHVTVVDNFTSSKPHNLLNHVCRAGLSVICGDVASVDLPADIDLVIHLAALVGYPICQEFPEEAWRVNYGAVFDLVNRLKCKHILASTNSIYAVDTDVNVVCTEESPVYPATVYGQSKAEADRIVRERGGIALRFATIFGEKPHMRTDVLPHDLMNKAVQHGEIEVYQGEALRCFLDLNDALEAYLFTIENYDDMAGQAFNVGNLHYTKLELAQKISAVTGCKIIQKESQTDPENRDYFFDSTKIQDLGFCYEITEDWQFDNRLQDIYKAIKILAEY